MPKEYTVRDPVVLAAHQLYLNKLIPAIQDVTKEWDLRACEGVMTCNCSLSG